MHSKLRSAWATLTGPKALNLNVVRLNNKTFESLARLAAQIGTFAAYLPCSDMSVALGVAKATTPSMPASTQIVSSSTPKLANMSTATDSKTAQIQASRPFAIFLIIAGLVGWAASFALTLERFHVASDPNATLSCDVASFISCKSVMLSPEAKLFGFPNPLIGLAAFMAPFFVGWAILAGAQFKAWFWRVFFIGHVGAFVFILWLANRAIFDINALCPYCMVAWAAVIPLFWQLFLHGAREGYVWVPIRTVGFFDRAYEYAWLISLVTALSIALAIAIHFWSLWLRFFGLV